MSLFMWNEYKMCAAVKYRSQREQGSWIESYIIRKEKLSNEY